MTKPMLFLLLSALTAGCGGDRCDRAYDRMLDRYEECGGDPETVSFGDVECTDEQAVYEQCQADCYEAADCAVIMGESDDQDAIAEFSDCANACITG